MKKLALIGVSLLLYLTLCGRCEGDFAAGPIEPELKEIISMNGTLHSPGLEFVEEPVAFVWIIKLPMRQKIVVDLESFNIPRSQSCAEAYLDIFTGPIPTSERATHNKMCGKVGVRRFSGKSNEMNVVYYTSKPNKGKGFKISWGSIGEKMYPRCGMCHVTPKSEKKKLFGSEMSAEGSWPWMVELTQNNKFFCHGLILTSTYILTTTSCLQGVDTSSVHVIVGSHVTGFREPGEQIFAVAETVSLPNDDDESDDDTITLLLLIGDVTFTPYVVPACLPPQLYKHDRIATCVAVGWGIADSISNKMAPLLEVRMEIESDEMCEKRLNESDISTKLSYFTHMSAKSSLKIRQKATNEKFKFGSPLMCLHNGRWIVVGLMETVLYDKTINGRIPVFIYKKVQEHLGNLEKITDISVPVKFYNN